MKWDEDDTLSEVRKKFYEHMKFHNPGREWHFSQEHGISWDLINSLRARYVALDETSEMADALPRWKKVSRDNEERALDRLFEMIEDKEELYNQTTVEQDMAMLDKTSTLNMRQRFAVMIRLGEKKLVGPLLGVLEDLMDKLKKKTYKGPNWGPKALEAAAKADKAKQEKKKKKDKEQKDGGAKQKTKTEL
mmetsp:Transcript_30147/g.70930  ORF Transcript_30147/g.70930 Transcript_30147/m.70930 type:complete len:191 (-) Transcript_30147:17-589(-)